MLDVLEEGARHGGSLTFVTRSGEDRRTYKEIVDEARALGAGLRARGVSSGTRVGLLAAPTMEFALALLATIEAGACGVLLPQSRGIGSDWVEQIRVLLRVASVDVTVGPHLPVAGKDHIDLSTLDMGGGADPSIEDGEGMVLFTSGTTGDPRGVVLSRDRMVARVAADAAIPEVDPREDLSFSWRDLSTSGGIFLGLIVPMATGASACVMETNLFSRAPERWLIEISKRRATISVGPNFAYGAVARRLAAGFSEPLNLSFWRHAYCVGERVDIAAIERFIGLTAPFGFEPSAFAPRYAMTEAGIVSVAAPGTGLRVCEVDIEDLGHGIARPARTKRSSVRTVSSGVVRKEVSLEILDSEGSPLGDRRVGEVMVRTPWLAIGYLGNPEETSIRFANGWFRTGDIGYIDDDELYITGRSKNVIIVGGRNFNGDDLERALQDVEGVEPSSVAVLGRPSRSTEEIVVFAETSADESEHRNISESIRQKLWGDFALVTKDVLLSGPGSLPRTSVGKLRREALRASLMKDDGPGP